MKIVLLIIASRQISYRKTICLILCFTAEVSLYSQKGNTDFHSDSQKAKYYENKAEELYRHDIDSCIYYTQKAIYIWHRIGIHQGCVKGYSELGTIYYIKKDLLQFESFVKKAFEEANQYLDSTDFEYGVMLSNYTLLSYIKGDYENALKNLLIAFKFLEKNPQTSSIELAKAYNNMGAFNLRIGDYAQAIHYFKQALALKEKGDDPHQDAIPTAYHSLGVAYHRQQAYDSALVQYRNALKVLPPDTQNYLDKYARFYISMGNAFFQKNELDSARKYLQLSLALQKDKELFDKDGAKEVLGRIAQQEGDYISARKLFEEVLNIRQQTYSEPHPSKSQAYYRIGKLFEVQHHYDSAMHYFNQAIWHFHSHEPPVDLAQNPAVDDIRHPIGMIDFLLAKGEICEIWAKEKEPTEPYLTYALSAYQRAAELIPDIHNSYQLAESKLFFANTAKSVFEHIIEVGYQLWERDADLEYLDIAFQAAEQNKSSVLRQHLKDIAAKSTLGLSDTLKEQERSLNIEIGYVEREIEKARKDFAPDSIIQQWESRLFEAREAYKEVISKLEELYPNYYDFKYAHNILSRKESQSMLHNKQTFIEYFYGDSALYVFSISSKNPKFLKLTNLKEIETSVSQVLNYLRNPLPDATLTQAYFTHARRLHQMLVAPLGDFSKRLIISPDGVLNRLPFEALLMTDSGASTSFSELPYLITHHSVSYTPSATLWQLLKSQSQALDNAKSWIGVAPIHFGASEQSLPGSKQELQAIQENWKMGMTFMEGQANKSDFIKMVQEASSPFHFVHFSTHAKADEQTPELSYIHFYGDQDSAKLYLNEWYSLSIPTQLIVLGACETGTGKLHKSEGVMHLARASFYSGGNSTLASLWKVKSEPNSFLMQRFYAYLAEGLPKDQALQKAKLDLLNPNLFDKAVITPQDWGAYLLIGNEAPIIEQNLLREYGWIVVLMGLVFGLGIWRFRLKGN